MTPTLTQLTTWHKEDQQWGARMVPLAKTWSRYQAATKNACLDTFLAALQDLWADGKISFEGHELPSSLPKTAQQIACKMAWGHPAQNLVDLSLNLCYLIL